MTAYDPNRRVGTKPFKTDLVGIGEGPGENEHRMLKPFVGISGDELTRYFREAGIQRKYVYLTNAVKFWTGPGNPDPDEEDLARDLPDLSYELFIARPKVIVTLGGISTRIFLPEARMDAVHGLPHRVDIGSILDWGFKHECILVPAYHPAAGMHQSSMAGHSPADIQVVGRVLRGDDVPVWEADGTHLDYDRIHPVTGDGADDEWPELSLDIAVDTEGYLHAPYCLTFSCKDGWSRMILASDKVGLARFQKFIRRKGVRLFMHWAQHDVPILEVMGIDMTGIEIHDTMVMAYELNEAGQGLKALCYRYLGMVMQDYEDLTHDADRKQAVEYLEYALRGPVESLPKPDPVLEYKNGVQHIRKPQHIKTRIATCLRPTKEGERDPRKAWLKIEPEIREPLESLIGPMPEFTLDLIPPMKVVNYACADADGTRRLGHYFLSLIEADERLLGLYRIDQDCIPIMVRMQKVGMPVNVEAFRTLTKDVERDMARIQKRLNEHNGGKYLNPASADQVRDLIFTRLGLSTRIKTKKTRLLSTNDKALEALKGKHPVIVDITDYRERAKIRGSFSEVLPYLAQQDGRIHPDGKLTRTVTGRRAYANPNLQAIPVRSPLGLRVRAAFEAPDGRFLASADLSQVEMRVMAHLSGDKKLIKLFTDGFDIHSITAQNMFDVTEEEAKKKEFREPAKRVGFGIITGITEIGLHQQLEMNGVFLYDQDDCKKMIADWFRIYQGVAAYIEHCRAKARRLGYAETMWGRRRPLPAARSDAFWLRQEAERDSHSHAIQGSAAEIQKRAEARMWVALQRPDFKWAEPLLTIHDETIMEGKSGSNREKLLGAMMVACMTADSAVMKVPLEAKYSYGKNWGVLK